MSGTNVESMAIKRYRRGKCAMATEKSLFSTSGLTGGAVQRLWSDAQTPYSACSSRRIGYNHCESPAMVAGAMLSGKSQLKELVTLAMVCGDNRVAFNALQPTAGRDIGMVQMWVTHLNHA